MNFEKRTEKKCLTCHDSGELVTEFGPTACPDCAGEPGAVGSWEQAERRIRDIEQRYNDDVDTGADVRWLAFELRRSRGALLRILTLCQDAQAEDALAAQVRHLVNDAMNLYRVDD